ncbi:MAG: hypothetical protein ACK514_14770 [Bacteroidota bacterium]|nr:hypothetical protein [Cytophagales bacterium]MCE2957316.1 hypothetical protein [Flammeovirgaceae bacterium]MCZ8072127.1 hypothetical protein [Cytophagales bacterium]
MTITLPSKKKPRSLALFHVRFILFIVFAFACVACSSGKKVVKPRYHHVWAKGNKYRIDIPIGNRHIRMFQRKRTKAVSMK